MLVYCTSLEEEQQSDFEVMYLQYQNLLYRVAFDILHDRYLAEDAVHQTFWKAAEHFSKISQPVCPKTKRFLVIICERASIDLYRKRRREDSISLDAIEYDIADTRAPILPEENGTVASAIARLPKTYREVLLLRYAYGYSTHEIAALLSFSHAKVSKCITRGKEKLRDLLEGEVE
ncbi:MAG: RNA polymerase sigma factor [Butyricicoccaceae bacterium]